MILDPIGPTAAAFERGTAFVSQALAAVQAGATGPDAPNIDAVWHADEAGH